VPLRNYSHTQSLRPYDGSTSWKSFREHFTRVAKANQWTTKEEQVQHLALALMGPAAEILRGFDDSSEKALDDLWGTLRHRFGTVDECQQANAWLRKSKAIRQRVIDRVWASPADFAQRGLARSDRLTTWSSPQTTFWRGSRLCWTPSVSTLTPSRPWLSPDHRKNSDLCGFNRID